MMRYPVIRMIDNRYRWCHFPIGITGNLYYPNYLPYRETQRIIRRSTETHVKIEDVVNI